MTAAEWLMLAQISTDAMMQDCVTCKFLSQLVDDERWVRHLLMIEISSKAVHGGKCALPLKNWCG